MKIAYVLQQFPSLSETFILREIRALRELGMPLMIYALAPTPDCKTHAAARPFAKNVTVLTDLPAAPRSAWRTALRRFVPHPTAWRWARRLPVAVALAHHAQTHGATRLHAHFATAPCETALMAGRMTGMPFSLSVHARDVYTQSARALRHKTEAADFIATCTDHARQRLHAQAPASAAKTVTIPHGVFPADYEVAPAAQRELVLAVGRLVPKKGFDVLVEACRILRDQGVRPTVAIVGDGPLRHRLHALVRRYGLEESLAFTGALSDKELDDWCRRACVWVAPSVEAADGDRDGLPNVLLEAMARGIPVVASTASAAHEAIEDGVQGFLTPAGDAAALADRIRQVIAHPERAMRMGALGRQRVLERFNAAANVRMLARRFGWHNGTGRRGYRQKVLSMNAGKVG